MLTAHPRPGTVSRASHVTQPSTLRKSTMVSCRYGSHGLILAIPSKSNIETLLSTLDLTDKISSVIFEWVSHNASVSHATSCS